MKATQYDHLFTTLKMGIKKLLFISLLSLSIIACKKDKITKVNENFDSTDATLISQGCLESGAHSTTGIVKLFSKNGEKFLVFEDFSTSAGPDLNVFLSAGNTNTGATDLGDLKGEKGNFYYSFNNTTNTDTLKNVLVWCVQYSVLFGNSTLAK